MKNKYLPFLLQSDISMPVVNPDLISTEPILFNPPNFEHSFETPAMRVVDLVLSHMNSPHWDITLETDLEKLVHAAHMQDVWYYAGLAYEEMKVYSRLFGSILEEN